MRQWSRGVPGEVYRQSALVERDTPDGSRCGQQRTRPALARARILLPANLRSTEQTAYVCFDERGPEVFANDRRDIRFLDCPSAHRTWNWHRALARWQKL